MKVTVVSYSFSGNNESLATGIAEKLKSEHIRIDEDGRRGFLKIVLEVALNWAPDVHPKPEALHTSDFIIFVGPVWMGKVATPLRPYFSYLKRHPKRYAFVSISGGAAGPNKHVPKELKERTGKAPEVVVDFYLADLMPAHPKPEIKDTLKYHLRHSDAQKLIEIAVKKLTPFTH